ncbi:unnamed protein product [Rotaria socialis]|uniref:Uncharacterized protein n=1 Tax=Rotaria socialis TaxID=392032 RepID=A0A821MZK7_9BILA|nr:unnamed protein product [Rotaria socialis]CAF3397317.1 unnamed protein product [Rotaria socialis]CAF3522963.1 unnamed protein product [Rotaria socialis]CAF4200348.1 unnamed protein product [Rotaria socialis]CAF4411785.1 unnamed protein product [Rotaria socialis]
MQESIRVAPKTIRFTDQIQVREIPNNEEEKEAQEKSNRRASWDPNLNNKDVFRIPAKRQRNCVIGCVVCGLIVVVIIVGASLGVILSQTSTTTAAQSLTYNAVCTSGSNQCKSSQNLYCPNGFCSCISPYSWNTVLKTCTLLTYNQVCSTSSQCNSSLGLRCTNQICQCDSYHSWVSLNNTCVTIVNNTLNYGDTCAVGSSQCNSSVELTCTGNCTCKNSKVWNISTCVCPAATFLNSSNLCQTAYTNNQTCTIGSNQCDSTRGLSCYNNSRCACDSAKYWNISSQTCLRRLNYSEACSYDSDCQPTLICPTIPGYCNCPLYLAGYVCNCANTTYYDSTLQQCVNRAAYNGSCISSANYTCLSPLYCNAGICN